MVFLNATISDYLPAAQWLGFAYAGQGRAGQRYAFFCQLCNCSSCDLADLFDAKSQKSQNRLRAFGNAPKGNTRIYPAAAYHRAKLMPNQGKRTKICLLKTAFPLLAGIFSCVCPDAE
ncbi:MAG: hypothetical protein LBH84_09585 [Prevotellaceae bacterium]|jgi:hypothetical protein|nr:hypothetical protein [Prevotellaceae bacterium]